MWLRNVGVVVLFCSLLASPAWAVDVTLTLTQAQIDAIDHALTVWNTRENRQPPLTRRQWAKRVLKKAVRRELDLEGRDAAKIAREAAVEAEIGAGDW